MFPQGTADGQGIQRIGDHDGAAADDQGEPQADIQSEGMEDGQIAQNGILAGPAGDGDDRGGIAGDVVVGKHNAFRDPGRAAGKDHYGAAVHIVPAFG